ncbi:hypothetical protein [Rhizobium sp. G21]|uniref:hypothetical protein n=1 Tax=Rhizobium sp. G21 TaxID=2758439 RepID=UPI0016029B98|nr:hypothetical protein [Rhizobium sp. G21]MBB1251692.1 hypothetical protein [Rhizobium sp. G21]
MDRDIATVIERADKTLAEAIFAALQDARDQAALGMAAIGHEEATPALEFFAAVVHQRMYCLMFGADSDTFAGGNPDIAYYVIRNSQNIARHYWSAEIDVYPANFKVP